MNRPHGIFALAADRLAGAVLDHFQRVAADSTLEMLGYTEPTENRLALLRTADFVSAPFRPQTPEAPGAHFFCGTADPVMLGLDDPPMSVAGCDLTPAGAFERCVGEAIEYLSQIASGIPASAGCAAGQTPEAAEASALWELIERDAIARWWHHGAPPAPLPQTPPILAAFRSSPEAPIIPSPLRGGAGGGVGVLRAGPTPRSSLRPITILLDITAHPGFPVAAACSFRADGAGFACGFGAHPDIDSAQKSAIRELIQMELGLLIAEAQENPTPNDLRQLARTTRVRPDHPALKVPSGPPRIHAPTPASTPQHILNHTRANLAALGMTPYATDLTQAMFAVPVIRVVVDGLTGIPDEAAWAEEGRPGTRIPLF